MAMQPGRHVLPVLMATLCLCWNHEALASHRLLRAGAGVSGELSTVGVATERERLLDFSHEDGKAGVNATVHTPPLKARIEAMVKRAAEDRVHHIPPYFWAGKSGDLGRTGYSNSLANHGFSAQPTWSFMPEGWDGTPYVVMSSALIDYNRSIYLAANNYRDGKWIIYKFNDDGEKMWQHEEPGNIVANPTMTDEKIFTALGDGHFVAVDLWTGMRTWKARVSDKIVNDFGAMTATDGVVVYSCGYLPGQNKIVALKTKDGSASWTFKPETNVYNFLGPVLEGYLVFTDHVGRVYKLDLKTGNEVWRHDNVTGDVSKHLGTGGAVIGPNRVVYVTSNRGDDQTGKGLLKALDFNNGKMLWERITNLPANAAPSVGHLEPAANGPLAVVIATGPNPGGWSDAEHRLTYNGGKGPKKGVIYAFNAKSGNLLWSFQPTPSEQTWAAGDDEMTQCWPDSFTNPTISGDGILYTTFMNGKMFAIQDNNHDGAISTAEVTAFDMGRGAQGPASFAPYLMIATPCNGMHVFKPNPSMPAGLRFDYKTNY